MRQSLAFTFDFRFTLVVINGKQIRCIISRLTSTLSTIELSIDFSESSLNKSSSSSSSVYFGKHKIKKTRTGSSHGRWFDSRLYVRLFFYYFAVQTTETQTDRQTNIEREQYLLTPFIRPRQLPKAGHGEEARVFCES